MYKKESRQVPVSQILALYIANFQHVSIILRRRPAQRPTETDYQGVVSISGNIWETFRVYSARSASMSQYPQFY